MIKDKDRSMWFGASDTAKIMGNWDTKTFAKWWCEKIGFLHNNFQTKYTLAGNFYEHKIANTIQEITGHKLKLDRQIRIRKMRLRVNLDSEDKDTIYEIKTFKKEDEDWKCPKNYIMQVRVQMWVTKKKGCIIAYPMEEENYKNFFLPIERERLLRIDIEQDNLFIEEYLKRLKYLAKCLKQKKYPKISEV